MNSRRTFQAFLAAVLLTSSSAWALGGRRFAQRGTLELSGNVGLSVASGGIVTFSIQPNVGYFVAKGLELSVSPGLTLTAGDIDAYALFLLLGPSYNFDLGGEVFPFIGLVGGLTRGSTAAFGAVQLANSADGTAYGVVGLEAGVKIPIGRGGLLRPQFQMLFIPALDGVELQVAAQVGAGVYF